MAQRTIHRMALSGVNINLRTYQSVRNPRLRPQRSAQSNYPTSFFAQRQVLRTTDPVQ
jgi:hypothetical protein